LAVRALTQLQLQQASADGMVAEMAEVTDPSTTEQVAAALQTFAPRSELFRRDCLLLVLVVEQLVITVRLPRMTVVMAED
jgi:hypothetical protein